MRHPNTRALFEYWNLLRDGAVAPFRAAVDPREIAPLLDSTFILEVQSPESVRFRLAGTKLCDNFGMELRGMSALALWHGDCRQKVRDVIEHVVSDPGIGHVSCTVENRGGFLYEAEFLYMPLLSDTGEMSRILGCGYYMGEDAAFAHLYDPIHHWVDNVKMYPIEIEAGMARSAPSPYRRRASDGQHGADPFNAIASAIMSGPALRAISGGRDAQSGEGAARRRTGHLRLVKSDAS